MIVFWNNFEIGRDWFTQTHIDSGPRDQNHQTPLHKWLFFCSNSMEHCNYLQHDWQACHAAASILYMYLDCTHWGTLCCVQIRFFVYYYYFIFKWNKTFVWSMIAFSSDQEVDSFSKELHLNWSWVCKIPPTKTQVSLDYHFCNRTLSLAGFWSNPMLCFL